MEWNSFLSSLWEYTESKELDVWHEKIAESIPSTISEYDDYIDLDFEQIDLVTFNSLKSIYKNSNPAAVEINS